MSDKERVLSYIDDGFWCKESYETVSGSQSAANKKEKEYVNSKVQEWENNSQAFDQVKAVMDLPETTYGETFTKLRKVKEIVEGME